MSESVWIPGLVVLALGAGFGIFLIWRLRGEKSAVAKPADGQPETADLDLRIRDLEQRRDDLYERIRRIGRGAEKGDIPSLEIEAARTLQQLDRVAAELPHAERKKVARRSHLEPGRAAGTPAGGAAEAAPTAPAAAAGQSVFGAHPLLAGFAFGVGMAALVGALVYFAVTDAKPKPQTMGGQAPAADVSSAGMPQDASAQLDELKARLEADPNDLMAKKEIALLLLQAGKWVEAFEVAGMVLQDNPGDPDGLYVAGVVRLRMGQSEQARDTFDEVLANYPQHIPALLYRGLAFYQGGNAEQAVDTWEYALDKAGDLRPQFESLLAMVERGEDPLAAIGFTSQSTTHPAEGSTGAPSEAGMTGSPAPAQPAEMAAAEPAPTGPRPTGFTVRVELAPGVQPPAGAVLFVYLRTGTAGPPVAVKRIPAAAFPIDIFLGQDDSMMGSAIPDSGNIVVRLDGDGNVMSRGADDLEAGRAANIGEVLLITLGG